MPLVRMFHLQLKLSAKTSFAHNTVMQLPQQNLIYEGIEAEAYSMVCRAM